VGEGSEPKAPAGVRPCAAPDARAASGRAHEILEFNETASAINNNNNKNIMIRDFFAQQQLNLSSRLSVVPS